MSLVVLAAVSGGCGGLDARLEMHREQLESLGSTTTLVGDAWLGGRISGTYARTALEQSYFLVERGRRSPLRPKRSSILAAPACRRRPSSSRDFSPR